MKRIAVFLGLLSVASFVALAEMPVTIVTPGNAAKQEVQFALTIVPQQRGDLVRVTLIASSKSVKYVKIGQPGLYLYRGKRMIGCVALYAQKVKTGEPASYWCDLTRDCLDSSTVTVACRSEKATDDDSQSMEYTLKLKDFIKKERPPNKVDAGGGK